MKQQFESRKYAFRNFINQTIISEISKHFSTIKTISVNCMKDTTVSEKHNNINKKNNQLSVKNN